MPKSSAPRVFDRFELPFRPVTYALAGLLLACLVGRFVLDQRLNEYLVRTELVRQSSFQTLQLNQTLLLKAKDAELAFQNYVTRPSQEHELKFNLNRDQTMDLLNQLEQGSQDLPTQSIFKRARSIVSAVFDDMGKVIGGGISQELQTEMLLKLKSSLGSAFMELNQLLKFVSTLEEEREKLITEEMESFTAASYSLNTAIALMTIAMLSLMIFGLRRYLFVPVMQIGQQMDLVDESSPSEIKIKSRQPEILTLMRNFNNLIRRLREREEQLEHARQKEVASLNKALQEKVEYSSVLAHEIRTPLNGIVGLLRLMGEEAAAGKASQNTLIEANKVAEELIDLVNSTLDYSRLEHEHVAPDLSLLPAGELLHGLQSSFFNQANLKQIRLNFNWKSLENSQLQTDRVKLGQILNNLIGNALKFTGKGGTVSITALNQSIGEPGEKNLIFEIADSGIGIPSSSLDLIFQPFKQADSGIKRKYGGTGIGLALSRQLAQCLGGTLSVESTVGVGSKFILKLPCEISQLNKVNTDQETASIELLKGSRALMVEDHIMNAKINMKLFAKHGVEFDWAETGEIALSLCGSSEKYDFILMDINLGEGLSGIEVTRLLKDRFGANCPPVFALTAGVVKAQREAILDCGMVDIIEKPFRLEDAGRSITSGLIKHRQRDSGKNGQTKTTTSQGDSGVPNA